MLDSYDLYVTSPDPIKEGFFLDSDGCVWNFKEYTPIEGDRKIIATTDKDLIERGVDELRNIFVEIYVKSLTDGNPIKIVDVQYNEDDVLVVREEGTIITYKKAEKTFPLSKVKEVAHDAWIESFFLKRNTDITGFEDWFSKYFNL